MIMLISTKFVSRPERLLKLDLKIKRKFLVSGATTSNQMSLPLLKLLKKVKDSMFTQ
jgi:hypothetical protein